MMKRKKQMSIEADTKTEASKQRLLTFKTTLQKVSKPLTLILILLFLNVGAKSPLFSDGIGNNSIFSYFKNKEENEKTQLPSLIRSRVHTKLVQEVKTYIVNMAPTSKIDPELLVAMAQKYDLDITFVLAQGLIESHYGTKGRAAITNSVFNVGAWNNRTIYTYKSANESIEPYMQLIRNEYLVNNKEIPDLIQDRGYRNANGHRYAESWNYEQSIRTLIANIDMQTSIRMYQGILKMSDDDLFAFFGPSKDNTVVTQPIAYNTNER